MTTEHELLAKVAETKHHATTGAATKDDVDRAEATLAAHRAFLAEHRTEIRNDQDDGDEPTRDR